MKPAATDTRQSRRAARAHSGDARLRGSLATEPILLTNGRYTVRLNELGSGYSEFDNAAVTRWSPDATCNSAGLHIYLRDIADQFVWSAAQCPTQVEPSEYRFYFDNTIAEIARVDRDISCRLSVCVSPEHDYEIRLLKLLNLGGELRTIEVTSYLEWVLGSRDADASHPAFAKLFVETSFCPQRNAVLASRRPRHCDEHALAGFHSIVRASSAATQLIEFETNRMRFVGRARSLARPQALDDGSALTGDVGSVLDPVAALRTKITLAPQESHEVAFVLGASSHPEEIDQLLAEVSELSQVHRLFESLRSASVDAMPRADSAFNSNGGTDERIIVRPPHWSANQSDSNGAAHAQFVPASESLANGHPAARASSPSLQFDNSFGGFSADGREYVIRIAPDGKGGHRRPPLPWVNVISSEKIGCIVTESGAGYTWAGNSRLNRLTAWHNDPVTDPHSEAIWIRDEEAGTFWSPTPGPTPAPAEYRVRHGFGYTTFEHESSGLSQQVTTFIDRDEPVKLTRLRIENRSGRLRHLSVISFLHWMLGGLAAETAGHVTTAFDPTNQLIWATNPVRDYYGDCVAFSAIRLDGSFANNRVSFTCDREGFLGHNSDNDAPAAVTEGGELDGIDGRGLDACSAWQTKIELPADASIECTFLLGEAPDKDAALQMIGRLGSTAQVQQSLDRAVSAWRDTLSAITIETPDLEIDLMVNGWLLYQNLSCRMWGRSAYYQPGGAFGYRDQLQDSAAFVYHRPDITRTQILRHAGQQFVEGDVLHWWHPDTGYGVRTRFSDDLLWLPYITAEYVRKTGDRAVLDEVLPFITAPPLADGHPESYLRPSPTNKNADVYEHCCQALDRGLTTGQNGLPLIGTGDWNDGFSRVGRLGKGESVWLGFFIDHILEAFLPICRSRGDDQRIARYTAYRENLRRALNTTGWDGEWYRRAYYDNGEPMGSAVSDECQIDALSQAWAVISGVAPAHRAAKAMEAAENRLVDEDAGIIRLLTPAFNQTHNDPGYIKGYLRGIRENGGQYTHGVLWVIRALAEMGRGTRAVELLRMLTPVWHTASPDRVAVYQTEPYVVAADVYGEPPHVGRGGWTWYTGSAGWMYRVAIESIFGMSLEDGNTLVLNPCISRDWPRATLHYRLVDGQTTYAVTIENPGRSERGVKSVTVDGESLAVENGIARVPLKFDGNEHRVSLRMS
jgi:cyclic beta-1,2-glucan synthetase